MPGEIGLYCGLAFAAGVAVLLLLEALLGQSQIRDAKRRIKQENEAAKTERERLRQQALLDARETALREREELLREVEKGRQANREAERDLEKRERQVDDRAEQMKRREHTLEIAQRKATEAHDQAEKRQAALDRVLLDQRELLQKITGLSRERAENLLLERLENDLAEEIGLRVLRFEQQLKEQTEAKAHQLLATAIQRYAALHTAETTTSTIDIPSDDMKGRIIGREGRNIRAFEKATGIDVIVDDTPGIVVVSSFDSIRREVGRIAMARLIADGRIHPTRIEEVVNEVREQLEEHILDLGRQAAAECEVTGLNEKLVQMLGKLKFRTSYSQNVWAHSIEVSLLCGLLADEMGLDPVMARRCGLLHDVGKALDQEQEGGHPKIGADVARRVGECPEVVHAIECHHDDIKVGHLYTVLVATADAISASRPGARRDTLERYVKRLEELEAVACGFPGIDCAYAIQAGREVRVIANSEKTSDKTAAKVCRDIATAIEERLTYPGEIKVTVVRETRVVEYAR